MISKSFSKTGKKCRVTFKLPTELVGDASAVQVLGDFNSWDPQATALERRKSGHFSTTESLDGGREYRFRYLVDGRTWLTDERADGVVRNRFGDLDGLLSTVPEG